MNTIKETRITEFSYAHCGVLLMLMHANK